MIIGLGNPGDEYANTYHNVGRMAVDAWAAIGDSTDTHPDFRRHGDHFEYYKSADNADGPIFVCPLVFMNESGLAVRDAMKAFDVKPEEILVIHDESDLPVGEYKVALGGGSAGHKGVQSIIDHLHTNDFWRARVGVRDPKEHTGEHERKKAGDFVLRAITTDDQEVLKKIFEEIWKEIN
jgi:peptidyl-tRNA hydrolase, PTH1 family